MSEGLVRDAILASPAWPDIAAAMGRLDAAGIDVARIVTDAHHAGVGVDQAVAAVTAAAKAPAPAGARAVTASAAPAPAATAAPAPAAAARARWAVGDGITDREREALTLVGRALAPFVAIMSPVCDSVVRERVHRPEPARSPRIVIMQRRVGPPRPRPTTAKGDSSHVWQPP
ncbi:hypothetical protein ACWGE1_18410 [Streptomyces sp. NPDC054932]